MPSLNIPRLLEQLCKTERGLYAIWLDCRNDSLADSIEAERLRLERIITALMALSPMIGEQEPIE